MSHPDSLPASESVHPVTASELWKTAKELPIITTASRHQSDEGCLQLMAWYHTARRGEGDPLEAPSLRLLELLLSQVRSFNLVPFLPVACACPPCARHTCYLLDAMDSTSLLA